VLGVVLMKSFTPHRTRTVGHSPVNFSARRPDEAEERDQDFAVG